MTFASTADQPTTPKATPKATPEATTPEATTPEATTECVMQTILDFLLPFFLVAAGGNPVTASAAIRQLIAAHNAVDATELDLAGRIVGFSIAALDNLRLSMAVDLPITRLLRYRGNAVSLSRASDQARKALAALRANPDQAPKTPRPSVAPAQPTPAPTTPAPTAASRAAAIRSVQPNTVPPHAVSPHAVPPHAVLSAKAASAPPAYAVPASIQTGADAAPTNRRAADLAPLDLEAMKRDARLLMDTFSRHGVPSAASMPAIADPATLAAAAARAAVAAACRPNSAGPRAA